MAHDEDRGTHWRQLASSRESGAGYVLLADGLAIDERFTALVTPSDPDMPICGMRIAIEGGRPVCVELRCDRQPGGRPITQAVLRTIPVTSYIREVVEHSVFRFTRDRTEGRGDEIEIGGAPAWRYDTALSPGVGQEVRREAREIVRARQRQPRRGIAVSDDDLREIAVIYRAALAEQRRPTKAVMEAMHVSLATASRWVARARDLGYLGPARPGAAGEINR